MAHYVMSDIHGDLDRFYAMLKAIRFSDEDVLYILGDVVDRGPHGIKLLQEIMNLPNVVMLLGNHEYMMMQYFNPGVASADIRRWNKNGNQSTKAAYLKLKAREQKRIMDYLNSCPSHLAVRVDGKKFYLVHGFPGENLHDEVWDRPEIGTSNPIHGSLLVVGHTPVDCLRKAEEKRIGFVEELKNGGEHLRIFHAPEFIDIDCGCGYNTPIKALACLRLEDMAEYYV